MPSVALGNTTEWDDFTAGLTTKTVSHTIATDSNLVMTFWHTGGDPGAFTAKTYGGAAMTEDTMGAVGGFYMGMWSKVTPATGAQDMILTWTNTRRPWLCIVDFKIANLVDPTHTRLTNNGSAVQVCNDTIATHLGGFIVEMFIKGHTDTDALAADDGQTVQHSAATSTDGIWNGRFATLDPSATPDDIGWSWDTNRDWSHLAYSIRPAGSMSRAFTIG